jgi:hypothetical protein
MDTIIRTLEEITNNAFQVKGIRGVAEIYLDCYRDGLIGSNHAGLMHFLQDSEQYFQEFGDVAIGVAG